MSELDLYVPAIVFGDERAFGRWLAAGAEDALRRGLARYAAAVDTEAVLQEALLRLWQVAPRFEDDGKPDGLLRLAHTIARNLALSEIRRRAPTQRGRGALAFDEAQDERIEATPPDPLLRAQLARCREQLPPSSREVFDARVLGAGRRSDAALAEQLGLKKNTLLKRFGRARALLLECLERAGVSVREELT